MPGFSGRLQSANHFKRFRFERQLPQGGGFQSLAGTTAAEDRCRVLPKPSPGEIVTPEVKPESDNLADPRMESDGSTLVVGGEDNGGNGDNNDKKDPPRLASTLELPDDFDD